LVVLSIALYLALGAAAANAEEAVGATDSAVPAQSIPTGGQFSSALAAFRPRIEGLDRIDGTRDRWLTCRTIAENLGKLVRHWAGAMRGTRDTFCSSAGEKIRAVAETGFGGMRAHRFHQPGGTLYTLDPVGSAAHFGHFLASEYEVISGEWDRECHTAVSAVHASLGALSPALDQCAQSQPVFTGNCSCVFQCDPKPDLVETLGKSVPAYVKVTLPDHMNIDSFGRECSPAVVKTILKKATACTGQRSDQYDCKIAAQGCGWDWHQNQPVAVGPACDWTAIPAVALSRR
jgi:hypothetical protein